MLPGLDKQRRSMLSAAGCLLAIVLIAGCARNAANSSNPNNPSGRYARLEPKPVPDYLRGSVLELTDMFGTEPLHFSGYGLVANLRGTGDSTAPLAVREYMIRQMVKHGFGTRRVPGYETMQPEIVLRDPRVAIVRVDGYVPPGARAGERFDVIVSALPQSRTTSLARGDLFLTDLRIDGANPLNPGGSVNVFARAEGPVFVNPAHMLDTDDTSTTQRASLRTGVIMDGGLNLEDRAIVLRLRQPERRMVRFIERRIDERFQQAKVAAAQDEAVIYVYVPASYRGDWEHFMGVVTHLFLDSSPEFVAAKAQELAQEAVLPDAPLLNISYCWEALGPGALPHIRHLMSHESNDVAFAAARAAAFLGDQSARTALISMARDRHNAYQIPSIQVLGALPSSAAVNQMLRTLIDSDQTLARIEAYKVLARNRDSSIFTRVIREKFVLDIVPSQGPPLVYASRRGIPRIALLGEKPAVDMPVTFTAFDNTLSISSNETNRIVTVFYRGPGAGEPRPLHSRPDLPELVARLGGEGAPGSERILSFSYADVVAILLAMSDQQKLSGMAEGKRVPAAFVLQHLSDAEESIFTAPAIPERSRPQTDEAPRAGISP